MYDPLSTNCVRLLELEPGKDGEPLACHLQIVSLDKPPPYEAISYVWGTLSAGSSIKCNGESVKITQSLNDVLSRIRHPVAARLLWADAICINQDDTKERAQQVMIMRKIYARARRVLVWLGPANDGEAERCRESIEEIVRACRSASSKYPSRPSDYTVSSNFAELVQYAQIDLRKPRDSQFWHVVARLFDRPWFSRIWVIQEVAESSAIQVMLGNIEINWHSVGLVATWIFNQDEDLNVRRLAQTKGVYNAQFMCSKGFQIEAYVPALAILQTTRDFGATDPRDKVYAMLSHPVDVRRDYYEKYLPVPSTDYFQLLWLMVKLAVAFEISVWIIIPWDWVPFPSFITAVLRVVFYGLSGYTLYNRSRTIVCSIYGEYDDFEATSRKNSLTQSWFTTTTSKLLMMVPDYSVSKVELFQNIVIQTMLRTRRLDALSYVYHGLDIDLSIPSWVPQWDVSTCDITILAMFDRDPYNAAGNTLIWFKSSTDPDQSWDDDCLPAQGLCFDVITSTSDVMLTANLGAERRRIQHPVIQQIVEKYANNVNLYPTGEDMETVCSLTLMASQCIKGGPGTRSGQSTEAKKEALVERSLQEDVRTKQPHASTSEELLSMLYRSRKRSRDIFENWNQKVAYQVCHRRRHFTTAMGYMGIGPQAMKPGDFVYVISGGCVPYILRLQEKRPPEEGSLYVLVGECYVHGIMDGEAMAERENGRLHTESFFIV
jgi:hypothetical protein